MKLSSLSIRMYGLLLAGTIFISCKETNAEAETEAAAPETSTTATAAPIEATTTDAAATPDTPVSNAAPGTATATAPGINPPHGQPGHRCEIPVGAPLNSQPNTAAPAQRPAQQPAPSFMQPAAAQPATTATTAPGMNPPHGQPGHRCDVAVGAPLPK